MAFRAATLAAMLGAVAPAAAGETPKYGGSLNFMIPADAPPSFDAHREGTFATMHSAAPFYSGGAPRATFHSMGAAATGERQ